MLKIVLFLFFISFFWPQREVALSAPRIYSIHSDPACPQSFPHTVQSPNVLWRKRPSTTHIPTPRPKHSLNKHPLSLDTPNLETSPVTKHSLSQNVP